MFRLKTRPVKSTAAILAAIMMLTALSGCGADNLLEPFKNNVNSIGIENANPEVFPGYEHFDAERYLAECDRLEAVINGGAPDKIWPLYDKLYSEAVRAYDFKSTAELGLDENNTNNYFSEESIYMSKVYVEISDRIKAIGAGLANGPYAEEFKAHIKNDLLFESYKSYSPLTGEAKELMGKEASLKGEYLSVYSEASSLYDDGKIDDKELNKRLGDVYVRLVEVRKQLAKALGYASYSEYADKKIFRRDYTKDDLKKLKDAVKKYGKDIDYYYYYGFADFNTDGLDSETILCDVGETVSKISEKADYAYTYLTNNNLVSAGFEDTRSEAQYTCTFPSTGSAIIELKHYDNSLFYNYMTFAHELGHFTNGILVNNPNPLFNTDGCVDVMEIHSNSLEMLFSLCADEVFENPVYYQGYEIASLSDCVLSGCVYDEWQRQIFDSEKALTLDEINKLYKKIALEYGIENYKNLQYEWMWVTHNFTSPLYYISYATSAIAALGIWEIAQSDFERAVSIWEKALVTDCYSGGYMETVNDLGLYSFNQNGHLSNLLKKAVDFMQQAEMLSLTEESVTEEEG